MNKGIYFVLILLVTLYECLSQTGIVSYHDIPFEKVGIYTYQYITPYDTFSENFELEKHAIKHSSNTLPLTNDTSYYRRDILLYATKHSGLQVGLSGKLPSEPLNIYYYDSTLCMVCTFHIYPGDVVQFLDLREKGGKKAFTGGCYDTPYMLKSNLHEWEYNGFNLFQMIFFYNQTYFNDCPIKENKYPRIDYYRELWYLHNVGFIYRHYCYQNEDYYVTLTHIEGVPLSEYLMNYKNSMCKYYGK